MKFRKPQIISWFWAAAFLLCFSGLAQAATRFVATGGTDTPDCTNSASPCKTIGFAITQAAASDTIQIAVGFYQENLTVNKSLTFDGAGPGTDPATATIIDGNGSGSVFDITAGDVTIQDVTIQNGSSTGGIHLESGGGNLTVTNSLITNNIDAGGILFEEGTTTLTLTNTVVDGNSSVGDGGGIQFFGNNMQISGGSVSGNTASGFGGGINYEETGPLTLTNVKIDGNTAGAGGGGIHFFGNNMQISGGSVSGNTASGVGGGIDYEEVGPLTLTGVTIDSNNAVDQGGGIDFFGTDIQINGGSISGNTVVSSSNPTVGNPTGGGINDFGNGNLTIIGPFNLNDNKVINNQQSAPAGFGGGITFDSSATSILSITAASISRNTAATGGGIEIPANAGQEFHLLNCTLSNNTSGGGGGALDVATSVTPAAQSTIVHCTIAGNTAGGINHTTDVGTIILKNTIMANSALGPNCGGTTTVYQSNGHNISDDNTCPLTGTGDFPAGTNPNLGALGDNGGTSLPHTLTQLLLTGSPAIDGVPTADCTDVGGTPVNTDQRGVPRPLDGDNNGTLLCDVGAVEVGCGDGVVEAPETCDDGNTTGGDGCSATCQLESCGNGIVDVGEQCDPQNTTQLCPTGQTCIATTCQCTVPAVCGNGILEPGEECDDGNLDNNDSCSSLCQTLCVVEGSGCNDSGPNICSNNGGLTAGGATLLPVVIHPTALAQWIATFAVPGAVFAGLRTRRKRK
jgi:cysteine-rich repeat protein